MQISFDINKITSFEDASAPFILYNSTRCACRLHSASSARGSQACQNSLLRFCSLSSVLRKFDAGVQSGVYPAAPKLESMDVAAFAPMQDQREWEVRLAAALRLRTELTLRLVFVSSCSWSMSFLLRP